MKRSQLIYKLGFIYANIPWSCIFTVQYWFVWLIKVSVCVRITYTPIVCSCDIHIACDYMRLCASYELVITWCWRSSRQQSAKTSSRGSRLLSLQHKPAARQHTHTHKAKPKLQRKQNEKKSLTDLEGRSFLRGSVIFVFSAKPVRWYQNQGYDPMQGSTSALLFWFTKLTCNPTE